MILKREFYKRDTLTVAKDLLGKSLVHEAPEGTTAGKIVETEAYIGPEDKASHAYGNLRTKRTEVQFGLKGHAYVYEIYGMYFCLNVTSGRLAGKPEAILVRALEPLAGIEIMRRRRGIDRSTITGLTNGPGRLCAAMGISKRQNDADLCASSLRIETGATVAKECVVQTSRINVDYAEEWKDCPLRFFIRDNKFVSKRPLKKQS